MNRENLFVLDESIKSFSISPENPTGQKGKGGMAEVPAGEENTHPARELGKGWKVRPNVTIHPGETYVMGDIEGEGMINHIWMTNSFVGCNKLLLKIYFDGCKSPSVDVPASDFFFNGWNKEHMINSEFVSVAPAKGYNCYWPMPFKKSCRITMTNVYDVDIILYYQIDYQLGPVDKNAGYFHALFRRVKELPDGEDFTVLPKVEGKGTFVAMQLSYGSHYLGWWGEGEVKMFIDGDGEYPTYCGTGTEDYFGGAWNFEDFEFHRYINFTHLYSGFHLTTYAPNPRFSMYRIHSKDPVRFSKDIKVTVQSIGWKQGVQPMVFNIQHDDLSAVAYFYLDHPLVHESTFTVEDLNF